MKTKITTYTLLIAALTLAACSKDDYSTPDTQNSQTAAQKMTFDATFEQTLAKASLSQNKTLFTSGDAISLFDTKNNNKFSTSNSGTNVTFTGTATYTENGYTALFPYDKNAKQNTDGTITTTIPSEQSGKHTAIIAVAKTDAEQNKIQLKNVNSIISLQTTQKCQSIRLEATKEIAGQINITINNDGTPTATATKGTKEITLTDAPNGGNISILPVQDVDITITCTYENGTSRTFYYYHMTFQRSEALNIGNLDNLIIITLDATDFPGTKVENVVLRKDSKFVLPLISGQTSTLWVNNTGEFYYNGNETAAKLTSDASFAALANNKKAVIFIYNENHSEFKTYTEGTEITTPTAGDNTQEGYELTGWILEGDNDDQIIKPGAKTTITSVNRTRKAQAQWTLKDIKITLDANGGQFADGTTTKTITHKWGKAVEINDQPQMKDDTKWFQGWDQQIDLKKDITLKAQWANYSKITYHDFSGATITDKTQKYKPGENTTIRTDISLPYPIASWNTKADGSGTTEYLPGSQYKLTGDISLYPVKSNNKPSTIDNWTIEEF